MIELPKCACGCGEPLVRAGRSGPPPRYASTACRMRASRKRRAPEMETFPGLLAPVPVRIASQDLEEQIARSILEAKAVGFALTRLGAMARPELSWRCTKLGECILTALSETFPDNERPQE